MRITDFYEYDLSKIVSEIRNRKAKKVLLQLPNGVKRFSYEIIDEILKKLGSNSITIDIDANPLYGSCIIDEDLVGKYDLVLHLGHEPYPYWKAPSNVVFIDLFSKVKVPNELLERLTNILERRSLRNVMLLTVQQHKNITDYVLSYLRSRGIYIVGKPLVITGCWFANIAKYLDSIDALVVIAGGLFHAIGAGLHVNASRSVFILDPYSNVVKDVTIDIRKILKIRLWKLKKAEESKTWLLIAGFSGQYRPYIIEELKRHLKAKGVRYYIAYSRYVTLDMLRNVDNKLIDAVIISSCPRLAIEDLSGYEKPVLTPGEALYVLGARNDYTYPW